MLKKDDIIEFIYEEDEIFYIGIIIEINQDFMIIKMDTECTEDNEIIIFTDEIENKEVKVNKLC